MSQSNRKKQRKLKAQGQQSSESTEMNVPPISPALREKIENNLWDDRSELMATIETILSLSNPLIKAIDKPWKWFMSHDCKYINLRIDMRDGGFWLTNGSGERIDLEALKWQYKQKIVLP